MISLKRKRVGVQLAEDALASLTGHAILNTVPISEMGFLILHQWLEEHHSELVEHYNQLSKQFSKGLGEVEHEILGEYKTRRSPRDFTDDALVKISLPIYDNRRLIGHAHKRSVSKAEMARQILIPWLEANQGIVDRFYERAAAWMEVEMDQARARLEEEFRNASR